jgi:hypothetical protein
MNTNPLYNPNAKIKNGKYKMKISNIEEHEITKDDLKTAKQIKINEHKISFPKQFAEKYESDIVNSNIINTTNNILPSLNSKNMEIQQTSNNSLIKGEKFLSFGEIIPNNSLKSMKKKIIEDRKMKDKLRFITENDFRTPYDPETDIQKFNNILKYSRLNSNKSSLIKYLNVKKINPLTIKVLSNQDVDKISKMNKMCQTMFQNQEQDKLFNDMVKDKVRQKVNNTRKEALYGIHNLGKEINKIQDKLKKYDKKVDNKEIYREILNDIASNYWKKNNLERFNKKSTPKTYISKGLFYEEDNE